MAIENLNPGPVRTWGELSTTYRTRESGDGESRDSNWFNTGTISASSYIWRPWFALVNGSLSLSVDESDAEGQAASRDEFTTGDLYFNLFPSSRFPFSSYFIESRNQSDNESLLRDVTTTEYGVKQQYRSLDGMHNYSAEYVNDQRDEDKQQNKFISESLLLAGGNRFGQHTIDTDLTLDTVDNTTSSEQAQIYALTMDHSYKSATNLTFDNLLSAFTTERDLIDASSDVDTAQLSSFLSWHPQQQKDLRFTGSLRLSETRVSQQLANISPDELRETESANANISQGLTYRYSDNLQLSESISANQAENNGEILFITTEALSARYSEDRINTSVGDYGWTAGTTYNNLHGDVESEQSMDNQFSQSLLNDSSIEGGFQLRTNLTQSLNYEFQSNRTDEKSIDHSFSVTWSDAAIKNQNLVRIFISDSHSLNRDDDYFQLVNLQYSGSNRISRYSRLGGNITLQQSQQKFEGQRSEETVSNGQLEFQQNRVFQVTGLFFVSELQLSKRRSESERFIVDSELDTAFSWENSLRYRIGRLEAQLDIDFIKVGDDYDQLFKFQLTRSFGDL